MNSESANTPAFKPWHGPNAHIAKLWALRLFAAGLIEIESDSTLSLRLFGELGDSKSPGQILSHICAHLKATENTRPAITGHLAANLKLLGKHFGLSRLEQDILAFRVIYRFSHLLEVTINQGFSDTLWTDWLMQKVLSTALKRSEAQIEEAMHKTARLGSSGLLLNFHGMSGNLGAKLSIMPGLATALSRPAKSIDDLLGHIITPVNEPTLSLEHYPHHLDDIQLIEAHLHGAIQTHAKGTNLLLHGDPGVGKTELANLLIKRLGLQGYQVTAVDNGITPDQEDIHPRFRSFMILQALLGKTKNGIVLFDEFEDVIPTPKPLGGSGPLKSWLNKILEEAQVPTIWISNHVAHLDPAYLRRFDMVLKIRNPPRSVRKQILTSKLEDLQFDEGWIDAQADDSSVSPAVLDRVVRVIRNVKAKGHLRSPFHREIPCPQVIPDGFDQYHGRFD
jgi:transitional endoplasmic reticulum ATPase